MATWGMREGGRTGGREEGNHIDKVLRKAFLGDILREEQA